MTRLYLVALLAFGAASGHAPAASSPQIQPSVDSAEQRQALRNLSVCLAKTRPQWARRTLAHPYLSDAQATAAAEALLGKDNCIPGVEAEVTFRTSGLVGSLAEHFVRAEIGRIDPARLASALSSLSPLNVTEDFALCVASRNQAAARALALSEPGSAVESEAATQLAAHLASCTNQGERLMVDLQALRALMATALYRGVTTVLAARN